MSEDWLPEPPAPPPPPKKEGTKTLFIWLLMIGIFVFIYLQFSRSPAKGDAAVAAAAGYSGWWIVLAAVAGCAAPLILLGWQVGGRRGFDAAQAPALRALAEENHPRAVVLLREVALRYRIKLHFRSQVGLNLGYALTRAGQSAEAVGVLLGVERTPQLAAGGIRQMVAIELARAFVVGGDVDKAARWLASARERTSAVAEPGAIEARLDAVEALLLCRQGKLDDARRLHERVWPVLEAYLTVGLMREQWLLRAFAAASQAGPRDAAAADTWLRMLRPMPPGALDWLTPHWPELEAFMAAHDLAVTTKAA